MTSRQQNIMKLQNLANELGLYYSNLNSYETDATGGELVFTYNLAEYKQYSVHNKCRFIIKQWFFLCAYIDNFGEFIVKSKIAFPGFNKKEHFKSFEEARQYIIDYMRYSKEHLVDVKLEKIKWDFE